MSNKIKSVVITMTTPYQKTVTQVSFDNRGREVNVVDIEHDRKDRTVGSMIFRWQSFYKDTFLIKEVFRSHSSINGFIDSSLTFYNYDRNAPYKLLRKSTTSAKEQKDEERYYYNSQGLLDSVSSLTNDSSYANGLRYMGDSLFYTTLQPCQTVKYFYSPDSRLTQTIECNNYSGPLPATDTDSIGCRRVINSYNKDTLVQEITDWYRRAGKVVSIVKQVCDKDGWTVYEERAGGEIEKTKVIKDKCDLVTKRIIYTYPPNRKMWATTITYKYYFQNKR